MGIQHPWITAPGEVLIAAYNHLYTSRTSSHIVVVDNDNYPYGQMSGTSMAAPCVTGIVALWLQAAQEMGKDMTTSDVKDVMKKTAIQDIWTTTGPNASHFGNGKIDALAGIQYILNGGEPVIRSSETALTFKCSPDESVTKQVVVTGRDLIGPITAMLSDPDNVFSMSVSGAKANGQTLNLNSGAVLDVTYSPNAVGTHTGTITLTSEDAESVTITLDGISAFFSEVTVCDGGYYASRLPLFGTYHDENQHNQMVYPASLFSESSMTGKIIRSMTFYPTTGSVTSSSSGTTTYYSGINFFNGDVTFKVANLPSGSSGFDEDNPEFKTAILTPVKTVVMPDAADPNATTWEIEFDEDFVYEGGDLLIDVSNTPADWGYTFFTVDVFEDFIPGYVTYESASTTTTTTYLPKVTFLLEAPVAGPSLSVDMNAVLPKM